MKVTLQHNGKNYEADLSRGYDISVPIAVNEGVRAWGVENPVISPVKREGFVGSVAEGGAVNFYDITFNPHGHGTHTEGLGHVSEARESINRMMNIWCFPSRVVTIVPEEVTEDKPHYVKKGDKIITEEILKKVCGDIKEEALVIRTEPNGGFKRGVNYSGQNPPYLTLGAITWLCDHGVKQLLVDMPSIDREDDDGRLLGHHYFFGTKGVPRRNATITELIFVPNYVEDGLYLLNLQVASFENDAAPSRPVLHKLTPA